MAVTPSSWLRRRQASHSSFSRKGLPTWTAGTIAVATDTGDHPLEQVAVAALLERAEAQRVQDGDRSGAHRKDVPKDAAHAGRRPLVGLNRRRVIVGFDLEHHRQPIPDVD